MQRTLLIWLAVAAGYGIFWYWYHGPATPLTPAEIDHYLERLENRGRDETRLAVARAFMEADDGREFHMVNLINLRASPLPVGDVQPGETTAQTLARYSTDHMVQALLRRAGYFVFGGAAAGGNIEQWGLDAEPDWRRAGIVRYRSRRDLMEIATDPRFIDASQYKLAAIEQTFAFPVAPVTMLVNPPRFMALLAITLGLLAQLVTGRRRHR